MTTYDVIPSWLARQFLARTFGECALPPGAVCTWVIGLDAIPEGRGWYLKAGREGLEGLRVDERKAA